MHSGHIGAKSRVTGGFAPRRARMPPTAAFMGLAVVLMLLSAHAVIALASARPMVVELRGPNRYERGWYHKAELGDTLPELANRHGVELRYLAEVNGLKTTSHLVVGSLVYIPPRSGHTHRVVAGETMDSVAKRYRLDPDYLAASNGKTRFSTLKIGEQLIVPTRARPLVSVSPPSASPSGASKSSRTVATSQTKSKGSSTPTKSARSTPTKPIAPPTPLPPATPSVSSGAAQISGADVESSPFRPGGGDYSYPTSRPEETFPRAEARRTPEPPRPTATPRPTPAAPTPAPSPPPATRRADGRPVFRWPVEGTLTRGFVNTSDAKHLGLDIAAPNGTSVRAAADGMVVYSGDEIPGYGRMVILDHGNGWATCYAHNSANLVRAKDRVRVGDLIARVGETGRATGPHLHFEVRRNQIAVDPLPLLP